MVKKKYALTKFIGVLGFLLMAVMLVSSCYSVRVVCRDCVPEADPLNATNDFYRGKKVHELDTTITLKPTEGAFSLIESCNDDGFYSYEYRVTFGGVLLSALSLGRKRKVKIKYVCTKTQN